MPKINSVKEPWPREAALSSLLDDESPAVRNSLVNLFNDNPIKAQGFLNHVINGSNDLLGKHARALQQELGWTNGKEDFVNFIRSRRYELETGWYLLDRTVFPNFDSSGTSLMLDKLADRVRELSISPMDPRQTCSILNRVLFHEYGFRGAGKNFEDPDNSFIHRVLDNKRGLPITLSLIYILVARRISFDLEPIGLPNRFMVGCFSQEIPFYIDVWAGGRFVELESMGSYLGLNTDECSGGILLPVSVAETLTRGCRNLVHHFALAGLENESSMFQSFVKEFERMRDTERNAS